jgi:hypothetical protein
VLNYLQNILHRGPTEAAVLLVLSGVVIILVVAIAVQASRLRTLYRRLAVLTHNGEGADLEGALTAHMRSVDDAVVRAGALEEAVGALQVRLPSCLQRVSLVRYDAFDDVGGEQSFAVALLDAGGNGVILSSIYTRQDVRMYAKSVTGGQASHTLSKEEKQALEAMT